MKAESLRLGDFDQRETESLLQQHSQATGQAFEPAALNPVWNLSRGQPWLVNALACETCFRMPAGRDRTQPISAAMVEQARENLILRRETHLDPLVDKLESQMQPAWYFRPDGRLDVAKLLAAFQHFFRGNAEIWLERFDYKEAGPHLLMQAFLQRIVNGGGRVDREYGLGRGRTDLLVVRGSQRAVIELKVLYPRRALEAVIAQGLARTWEYADRCATEEAHLVIFDRDPGEAGEEKVVRRQETCRGREITVWGM